MNLIAQLFGAPARTDGPMTRLFRIEYARDYHYMIRNGIDVNEKMATAFLKEHRKM